MLKKLFWALVGFSVLMLVLYILGYKTLEISLFSLVTAIILMELLRIEEGNKIVSSVKEEMLNKLESIERMVSHVFKSAIKLRENNENIEKVHYVLNTKLENHKKEVDEKLKNHLDMLAKKLIEIENKITELKSTSDVFHKRLNILEDYLFEEEEL